MSAPSSPLRLAGDAQSLAALRTQANADPKAALREAAKQFEALFMQEVMKSLRAATLQSGLLDNEGSKLGTDMLDQQMATQLTGLPGGLSEAITRQLQRQLGTLDVASVSASAPAAKVAAAPVPANDRAARIPEQRAADFVQQHTRAAQAAEAATGIPAAFMIGQAAHESGWGRREILHADGTPSHNLFGIKAGADWKGAVAEAVTTEVIDGRAVKTAARFRAYASHAESFADYARLMAQSPRYRPVLERARDAGSFASGLQRAGYATDPQYADKLTRVINTTLRLQRLS
ncbi:MAG TPA: flagellar assembly peptidoglycan hydrolase FlgJ [Rubrivivax sp.]|nr:flagellar assembly peptidoglycan hydrolase FlgJ [Rubrivivax sp.]HPO19008.1 flagellar assembly peptidoglycan hydrolase FlgJ [Rubrivivax sp.]